MTALHAAAGLVILVFCLWLISLGEDKLPPGDEA